MTAAMWRFAAGCAPELPPIRIDPQQILGTIRINSKWPAPPPQLAKTRIVVTVTSPAGKPLHSAEDLDFAKNTIVWMIR